MARDEHNKAAEHHENAAKRIVLPPNITARATTPKSSNMRTWRSSTRKLHITDQAHSTRQQQK